MTEIKNLKDKLLILSSVFFVSLSLFIYQVVLTRIYSVILWYNYVFLITSFAIFGLGVGSIFAYKKQQRSLKIIKKKLKIIDGGTEKSSYD